jgi:hypothetical protein
LPDHQRALLAKGDDTVMLQTVASRTPSKEEVIKFLDGRLVLTRERIAKLREVEEFIVAKLARYRKTSLPSNRNL